jgi:2,3-dihydroxybiphenyl 1,2-dioxygenase
MTGLPALRLGYMVIESERLDQWESFARDGIGLHADRLDADTLALRLDDRERRLVVHRGKAEDVVALGWETDDEADLVRLTDHLRAQGVALHEGSAGEAELRGVLGFSGFAGLKGLRFEFATGARRTNQPLVARVSGFETGAGGLGHAALVTRNPDALVADMQRLLGALVSDRITDRLGGVEMEFTFLHVNERHHSLAVAATAGRRIDPLRTRVQHVMIEAATLEDVGDAYLRCKAMGYRIAMSMGQHPNDRGTSFYVVGPSGFEVELGCTPVRIGRDWQVGTYRGISKWGHQPEFRFGLGERLGMAVRALRSLRRRD